MTVAVEGNPQHYVGTGANTALNTVFKFFTATDVIVTQRTTLTGATVAMVKDVHYTLTGGSEAGAVGVVTPIAGATDFTTLMTWTIQRLLPVTQPVGFIQNGSFPSVSHEAQADRRVLISQDNAAELDRAIRIPVHDPAATVTLLPNSVDRADKALVFDANGNTAVATQTTIGYGRFLLDTDEQTNVSVLSVSFLDWPAVYDQIMLEFIGVRPTGALESMRIEPIDNGTATGSSLRSDNITISAGTSNIGVETSLWSTNTTVRMVNTASDALCGVATFTKFGTNFLSGTGLYEYENLTTTYGARVSYRRSVAGTRWDGFEISMSAGNITGKVKMWGLP